MTKAALKEKGTAQLEPLAQENLPATHEAAKPPATRAERMAADAGKGISTHQDDKIIPMIRVLQAQSPQCLKQKPEYIKGAEAGDFYMKGLPEPIIKGTDGFEFQPCAFLRAWLEFDGPRDSNPQFIARHADDNGRPKGVTGLKRAEDGYDYINSEGHRFSFSREYYGIVNGRLPFMFPFGGSGHTTAREWQTFMETYKLPDGRPEPVFNRKYKIVTVPKSNKSGDWYGVQFAAIGEVADAEYDMGSALHEAVMSGAKVAEEPTPGERAQGESDIPF